MDLFEEKQQNVWTKHRHGQNVVGQHERVEGNTGEFTFLFNSSNFEQLKSKRKEENLVDCSTLNTKKIKLNLSRVKLLYKNGKGCHLLD